MKSLLSLVIMMSLGCGTHESVNSHFQKTGELVRGEKVTDPVKLFEAAIFDGDEEAVSEILAAGYPVDQLLTSGRTPLAESVLKQKTRLIRVLLKAGAQIELAVIDGQAVSTWVEQQGSVAKGRLWRALNKNIEDDTVEIFDAVSAGNFKVIKTLLDEGVDVNVFNTEGETCLTLAIDRKIVNSIRALLAAPSIDVNLRNISGLSPLGLAIRHNLKSVIAELKKRNAQE